MYETVYNRAELAELIDKSCRLFQCTAHELRTGITPLTPPGGHRIALLVNGRPSQAW